MNHRLAIIAPQIGAYSETFIRRHMEDLLPNETVVIAGTASKPYAGHWNTKSPTLILDQTNRSDFGRLKSIIYRKLSRRPFGMLEARRFLHASGVKVVISEYLDLSLPWLNLALDMNIQFFAHAHGYDISERLLSAEWRRAYLAYNNAAGVFTRTAESRTKLIELGLNPAKVHVNPGGIDVLKEPILRPEKAIVQCVAVGRMVTKKGPIFTLDAFRRAAEVFPHLHLDFIGGGELFPAAAQYVRAFGLSKIVTLHGSQHSNIVQKLLAEADIFIQHSIVDPESGDAEGLPAAIQEAMGWSLPVVSTFHAGIPEAVIDGETGFLVEEGDCIMMAEKLVCLAKDGNLRNKLGTAGWKKATAEYTWEQEKRNLLTLTGLSSGSDNINF